MPSVESYLAALPPGVRATVDRVRDLIHEEAPGLDEVIAYGVLAYRRPGAAGRAIVHVGGWARHVAVYPVPVSDDVDPTLGDDVAPYVAGRGTLRFALADPLPEELLRRVVGTLVRR